MAKKNQPQLAFKDIDERVDPVDLKGELRKRFLWYAISTIASRALPDVRDGLKPVHRRILYAMYRMRLTPDGRYRKSAAVVGDVLGKYHPHGDQAAYDTMVRMAQEFSMRYPLVDGQGNYGSIDGDSAAAMRYTEARLMPMALELLKEIESDTVPFRPNYDNTLVEPAYLPSRVPNILINGASGIAVGMATNIPPHNLGEVVDALIALIDNPDLTVHNLLKFIKGPDFPTGAVMLADRKELRQLYEEGRGPIKQRGTHTIEEMGRGRRQIVITSLPYAVNKAKFIERVAQIIIGKKLPALHDVRDESERDIRVVIELKGDAEINKVMAYLYKFTDLENTFNVNMTALDPNNTPRRMSLVEMLSIFIDFRVEVTEKRLTYELNKIKERLHILEGLVKVLKDLDAAIAVIRKSKNRDEARQGLMKKFVLDEVQANAVLDLRLSSLVTMEIDRIKLEAMELGKRRSEIETLLGSKKKIRNLVKEELTEVKETYGDRRRTFVEGPAEEEEAYTEADFIQHEATFVIVSRNGWVRRMKKEPVPEQLRFKDKDSLFQIVPADTSEHIVFFSSAGKAYVTGIYQLNQTAGFGDPVQSLFKFGDGERIVAVDHLPHLVKGESHGGKYLVVMDNGNGFTFEVDALAETTKAGKKFANVKGDTGVFQVVRAEHPLLYIAGSGGKALLMDMEEIPLLSGPGAGVRLLKIKPGERIVGIRNVSQKSTIRLVFDQGRDVLVKVSETEVGSRATTGRSYGGLKKNLVAVLED